MSVESETDKCLPGGSSMSKFSFRMRGREERGLKPSPLREFMALGRHLLLRKPCVSPRAHGHVRDGPEGVVEQEITQIRKQA